MANVAFYTKKTKTALNALTRLGEHPMEMGINILKEMSIPLFSEAIGAYENGDYWVLMLADGTKVKFNDSSSFVPDFADTIDITITKNCDIGCPWCYAGCTRDGQHADLFAHPEFYETLRPYTEVAINLNDMYHPQLDQFLEVMKHRRVIVNGTINEAQLFEHRIYRLRRLQNEGLIRGIGISYNRDMKGHEGIHRSRQLNNVVVHVISGLFNEDDMRQLAGKNIQLLILGYKKVGRGESYVEPEYNKNVEWLKGYLKRYFAGEDQDFRGIAFDTLALKQLEMKNVIPEEMWDLGYMGEDGESSFYLDMVSGTFAISSSESIQYPVEKWDARDLFHKALVRSL